MFARLRDGFIGLATPKVGVVVNHDVKDPAPFAALRDALFNPQHDANRAAVLVPAVRAAFIVFPEGANDEICELEMKIREATIKHGKNSSQVMAAYTLGVMACNAALSVGQDTTVPIDARIEALGTAYVALRVGGNDELRAIPAAAGRAALACAMEKTDLSHKQRYNLLGIASAYHGDEATRQKGLAETIAWGDKITDPRISAAFYDMAQSRMSDEAMRQRLNAKIKALTPDRSKKWPAYPHASSQYPVY